MHSPHSPALATLWLRAPPAGLVLSAPLAYGKKAGLDVRPSRSNICRSSLRSLLGVVSSLSPSKMLLAPAMKQRACVGKVKAPGRDGGRTHDLLRVKQT